MWIRLAAVVAFLCVSIGSASSRAAFPGTNGPIAAVGDCDGDGGEERGIVVMQPDGKRRRCVLSEAEVDGRYVSSPVWSPDGRRIAFTASAGSRSSVEVYLVDSDGSNLLQLTDNRVFEGTVSWSPNGRRLLLGRGDSPSKIFVMDADGSDLHLVEERGAQPFWSPDGEKVAFSWHSKATDNQAIFTVNIDGTQRTRLTGGKSLSGNPSWSPDGKRLIFVRGNSGSLWMMRRNGTHEHRILRRSSFGRGVWSPNDRWVLFVRDDYLMKFRIVDHSMVRLPTEGDRLPDWQAR